MNTISVTASRSVKNVKPFNVLSQLISRQFSGCLRMMSDTTFWSIYFDQGDLLYGTTSVETFERLERHLNQIGQQEESRFSGQASSSLPSLTTATRVQEQLIYEQMKSTDELPSPDYQAICWLVDQNYLNYSQASYLIEAITREALESLFCLENGTCRIFKANQQSLIRKLCRLNTRGIIDSCRKQVKWKRHELTKAKAATPISTTSSLKTDSISDRLNYRLRDSQRSTPTSEQSHSSLGEQQGKFRAKSGKNTYVIGCIDDSPAVLKSLRSCLDDKQFSVFTVNNPVKALMTIIRNKPDLILLDVMMPELDGYELCSLLRKHPEFKGTPIIIVTSNTGLVDRAKAKVVRASGYLTKPFTKDDLMKLVGKYLQISSN